MSLDDRDYYNESKKFTNALTQSDIPSSNNDDAYWRKKAEQQQEQIRNLIVLGVSLFAVVWFFGEDITSFLKSVNWTQPQSAKTAPYTPPVIPPHPSVPEQQFPESGSIIQYQQVSDVAARFEVISDQGRTDNCVVKLETWDSGLPVIEIFVKAGEHAETHLIPLGEYRVKYACGTRWYGRSDMFGNGTVVSVGVTSLKFAQQGSTISGNVLTLTKVINGNFKTNDSYFNKF